MEKFNILNVLILSTPEFFLCLMFSLVLLGEGDNVPFKCNSHKLINKSVKMLVTAVIISLFDAIADHFLYSINVSTFLDMIAYCLLLKYLYKLSWKKSILGVVSFALLMISLESMYVPFCVHYFYNGNEANLFNSPEPKRFFCFLPIRMGQIIAIVSIWNFNFAIQKIKQYKINITGFIAVALMIFFFEINITKIYMDYFALFSIITKITLGLCCLCSGIFNFVLLYMYIKVITGVSKFHLERSNKHG